MALGKMISDEFGLSFEVAENSGEIKGLDCVELNHKAINKVATILKTSLGPNGRDKIIVDQDGKIIISNDGRTIAENYVSTDNTKTPSLILAKQLCESQDDEIGDGTTSVIILANELLKNGIKLLKRGIHPVKVTEGFTKALNYAIDYLGTEMAELIETENLREICIKAAKTSLSSKVASNFTGIAEICVDSMFCTFLTDKVDKEEKKEKEVEKVDKKEVKENIDLEKINVKILQGGVMNETEFVSGIVIEREMVISNKMLKVLKEKNEKKISCKLALLACPFEPPRLKNKGNLTIKTESEYQKLSDYEKKTFIKMIKAVKDSGADIVLCQWGFDDEATSMLLENDLPAIRWVPGHELGYLALLFGAKIVCRFEDLDSSSLGVGSINPVDYGTENKKIIYFKNFMKEQDVCTILIKSSNKFLSEEIERSIRDALCSIRNIMNDKYLIYGGGSAEINLFLAFANFKADPNHILNLLEPEEFNCFKEFGDALLIIPEVLSANSGYSISYVEGLISKSKLSQKQKEYYGVDCYNGEPFANMREIGVFESFKSKKRQYSIAVDFVNSILKINNAIRK